MSTPAGRRYAAQQVAKSVSKGNRGCVLIQIAIQGRGIVQSCLERFNIFQSRRDLTF